MKRIAHYALLTAVLVGVPLACVWLWNRHDLLAGLLAFPPRTEDWGTDPSKLWNMRKPFFWPAFIVMAANSFAVIAAFAWRMVRGGRRAAHGDVRPPGGEKGERSTLNARGAGVNERGARTPNSEVIVERHFPQFGWFGLALGAVAWALAWSRLAWFAPLQAHTFLPLWFAYILVMNALCVKRSGRCLMTSFPRPYVLLFPVSAAFWWFFEYLNRYVWNWYYRGVEGMSAAEYALYATCSFATVLPAVTATAEWLATFRPFSDNRLCGFVRVNVRSPASVAGLALTAAVGLTGIVFWPHFTFPLLWISPLAVFLALQVVTGQATVLDGLRGGDWRLAVRFAFAALMCGGFWEMWNYHSLAKWVYAVPYVHAFQIFEMPIVGYGGYLPFGLECAAVAAWILPQLAGLKSEKANVKRSAREN